MQGFFNGFKALARGFALQNERRRRNFLRFDSDTKGILPYKMSAAGENFNDPRQKGVPETMF